MSSTKFPVFGRLIALPLPEANRPFLLRYLTAALAKDVRTARDVTIRSPREYAIRILERRAADLRDRGGEAYEEMESQMARWLRKAEDAAGSEEPDALVVADLLLGGTAPELAGASAWALVGHECAADPGCEICVAAEAGDWGTVLAMTETPPEVLREHARALIRCGLRMPWDDSF